MAPNYQRMTTKRHQTSECNISAYFFYEALWFVSTKTRHASSLNSKHNTELGAPTVLYGLIKLSTTSAQAKTLDLEMLSPAEQS